MRAIPTVPPPHTATRGYNPQPHTKYTPPLSTQPLKQSTGQRQWHALISASPGTHGTMSHWYDSHAPATPSTVGQWCQDDASFTHKVLPSKPFVVFCADNSSHTNTQAHTPIFRSYRHMDLGILSLILSFLSLHVDSPLLVHYVYTSAVYDCILTNVCVINSLISFKLFNDFLCRILYKWDFSYAKIIFHGCASLFMLFL